MTLTGGIVPQNPTLAFSQATRLIMDVTLGHVYDTAGHTPKPTGIRTPRAGSVRNMSQDIAGKGTPSLHLCATRLVNVVSILSDGSGAIG